MRAIEIFAGIGGLAAAFARHRVSCELLVDFDPKAYQTLLRNAHQFGPGVSANGVIKLADVRHLEFSRYKGVDLVFGGPPCQPFSFGGKSLGRQDTRDGLLEAVRAVRQIQPRAFVFENVRGLVRERFQPYLDYICSQLAFPSVHRRSKETWISHLKRLREHRVHDAEYRISHKVLNAADYGVPQKRERFFVVGFRSDVKQDWSFPDGTHSFEALLPDQWETKNYWKRHQTKSKPTLSLVFERNLTKLRSNNSVIKTAPWNTVRDAISSLPAPYFSTRQKRLFLNHELREGARSYVGHTGCILDMPAKTIKAGNHGVPGGENMLILPNETVRYFTVRECARLQTFPDDFELPEVWSDATKQLGNAVPIELGSKIAKSVVDALQLSG